MEIKKVTTEKIEARIYYGADGDMVLYLPDDEDLYIENFLENLSKTELNNIRLNVDIENTKRQGEK